MEDLWAKRHLRNKGKGLLKMVWKCKKIRLKYVLIAYDMYKFREKSISLKSEYSLYILVFQKCHHGERHF